MKKTETGLETSIEFSLDRISRERIHENQNYQARSFGKDRGRNSGCKDNRLTNADTRKAIEKVKFWIDDLITSFGKSKSIKGVFLS